jgi:hypothetical protein
MDSLITAAAGSVAIRWESSSFGGSVAPKGPNVPVSRDA